MCGVDVSDAAGYDAEAAAVAAAAAAADAAAAAAAAATGQEIPVVMGLSASAPPYMMGSMAHADSLMGRGGVAPLGPGLSPGSEHGLQRPPPVLVPVQHAAMLTDPAPALTPVPRRRLAARGSRASEHLHSSCSASGGLLSQRMLDLGGLPRGLPSSSSSASMSEGPQAAPAAVHATMLHPHALISALIQPPPASRLGLSSCLPVVEDSPTHSLSGDDAFSADCHAMGVCSSPPPIGHGLSPGHGLPHAPVHAQGLPLASLAASVSVRERVPRAGTPSPNRPGLHASLTMGSPTAPLPTALGSPTMPAASRGASWAARGLNLPSIGSSGLGGHVR